jgi:hypothetical protein
MRLVALMAAVELNDQSRIDHLMAVQLVLILAPCLLCLVLLITAGCVHSYSVVDRHCRHMAISGLYFGMIASWLSATLKHLVGSQLATRNPVALDTKSIVVWFSC